MDTHHFPETWPFEYEFLRLLGESGFRGVLMLDDIHLNPQMKRMWRRLASHEHGMMGFSVEYTARDVTALGHSTGTGVVDLTAVAGRR